MHFDLPPNEPEFPPQESPPEAVYPHIEPPRVVSPHVAPPPAPPARPKRSFGIVAWLQDLRSTHLSKSTFRIRLVAVCFAALYLLFVGRLAYFGLKPEQHSVRREASDAVSAARPDLVDRNGEILATDVKVMSIFAEPRRIIDKDEAVELLTAVLPDVDARELRERLGSRKGFVWVKRAITPKQQQEVYRLGLPGVGFLAENKRVYPNGPVAAHVLGFASLDGIGMSGLEKYIDGQGL